MARRYAFSIENAEACIEELGYVGVATLVFGDVELCAGVELPLPLDVVPELLPLLPPPPPPHAARMVEAAITPYTANFLISKFFFMVLYSLVYSNVQSDDVAQPALHAPTLVIGLEGEFLERSGNVNHPDP
ncbi:hypothetical protein [Paraburkholderia fungorum]|jgi:hypothetical protein|uniref:hypothetical protein n=1 Tax=Paraburkholderia fungorum TaxID=134537 RepID=UPI0011B24528|nr:hypothetical protein [Paraburkholderia fungorum]